MCVTVSGYWRPCCRFNERVQPDEIRRSVHDFSYSEWRNSEFYQGIIEANKTGWHEGCKGCQVAEETGNTSTREMTNKRLSGTPNQLEYIEISLSNECNLACKMCFPWSSSTWNTIANENANELEGYIVPMSEYTPLDFEKIIEAVDITHLNSIKLLGGEPFITPQTHDFFRVLDEHDLLGRIQIITNSNGTFFPKKLRPYLDKVRSLSVAISIDGIGAVNDYIRYKSNWDVTLDVLNQWHEFYKPRWNNSGLKIATVINAYNVHQTNDILAFGESQNLPVLYNIINSPQQLRLETLPEAYVDEIKDRFKDHPISNNIYRYLTTMKYDVEGQKRLKEYTIKMDKITGLKLEDSNPLLAKYLFNR